MIRLRPAPMPLSLIHIYGIIFDIARKSQIYALMQNIIIHFDRVRSIALASVKNQYIVEDHEKLVEIFTRKDVEQAEKLMQAHLKRYKIDPMEIRAAYPQYFK